MAEEKQSFESILGELKEIVHELEEGDLPLERALERFEAGIRLSREGARRLEEVESRVEEILQDGSLRAIEMDEEGD